MGIFVSPRHIQKIVSISLILVIFLFSFGIPVTALVLTYQPTLLYAGSRKFQVSGKVPTDSTIISKGFQYRKVVDRWSDGGMVPITSRESTFTAWIPCIASTDYEVRTYAQTGKTTYVYSDPISFKTKAYPDLKVTQISDVTNTQCRVHVDIQPHDNMLTRVYFGIYDGLSPVPISEYSVGFNINTPTGLVAVINIQNLQEGVKYYFAPFCELKEGDELIGTTFEKTFSDILPPITPSPTPTTSSATSATTQSTSATSTTAATTTSESTSESTSTTAGTSETSSDPTTIGSTSETSMKTSGTAETTTAPSPSTNSASTSDPAGDASSAGGSSTLIIVLLGFIATALVAIALILLIRKKR